MHLGLDSDHVDAEGVHFAELKLMKVSEDGGTRASGQFSSNVGRHGRASDCIDGDWAKDPSREEQNMGILRDESPMGMEQQSRIYSLTNPKTKVRS